MGMILSGTPGLSCGNKASGRPAARCTCPDASSRIFRMSDNLSCRCVRSWGRGRPNRQGVAGENFCQASACIATWSIARAGPGFNMILNSPWCPFLPRIPLKNTSKRPRLDLALPSARTRTLALAGLVGSVTVGGRSVSGWRFLCFSFRSPSLSQPIRGQRTDTVLFCYSNGVLLFCEGKDHHAVNGVAVRITWTKGTSPLHLRIPSMNSSLDLPEGTWENDIKIHI